MLFSKFMFSAKRSVLKPFLKACVFTFATIHLSPLSHTAFAAAEASKTLTINSIHSDPDAKKAFDAVLEDFKKEFKDIDVKVNTIDHESYKVQIRTWLPTNPPDIATWFAGNRAAYFVEKGLVEPIDDVWQDLDKKFPTSAKSVVTFHEKKYLLPTNYYHWGFFYRKDVFQNAGIAAAPATWVEFKEAVQKLKKIKVVPITIGTKQGWPAAGWFDFLDMRINGAKFHLDLLAGKEKFTDVRVKKTFAVWKEIIDDQAFPKNAAALTWQEARALLFQGKAGMYLMGNFLVGDLAQELKEKIGFFPFPTYDAKIPNAEVAPTDVFFIPSKAKHKDNAKLFLKFMARADVQTKYNQISGLLPPNLEAKVDTKNTYLVAGQKLLSEAASLSQFFDRDAEPEVAKVAMDSFIEFLSNPSSGDKILERVENTRARVHKVN